MGFVIHDAIQVLSELKSGTKPVFSWDIDTNFPFEDAEKIRHGVWATIFPLDLTITTANKFCFSISKDFLLTSHLEADRYSMGIEDVSDRKWLCFDDDGDLLDIMSNSVEHEIVQILKSEYGDHLVPRFNDLDTEQQQALEKAHRNF